MAIRPNYRDDAFVIRSYKLGEADLIIVALTKQHGVVRAVAKGARKTKSRLGAHVDRFSRVNVQIYPGRGLGKLTDAAVVEHYAGPIIADVDAYFAASAVLELAQAASHEPDAAAHLFELVDRTLAALARDDSLPAIAQADRFLLHALQASGWAPSLVDCAQCGRRGPHNAFHPAAGGAVCVTCRPPGSSTPPPQAVRLLWLLQHDRLETVAEVIAQDSTNSVVRIAHELMLAYARQQLEMGLPAYSAL